MTNIVKLKEFRKFIDDLDEALDNFKITSSKSDIEFSYSIDPIDGSYVARFTKEFLDDCKDLISKNK